LDEKESDKLYMRYEVLSQLVDDWAESWGPMSDWLVFIDSKGLLDEDLNFKIREGEILFKKVTALGTDICSVGQSLHPDDLELLWSNLANLHETCTRGITIAETAWRGMKLARLRAKRNENSYTKRLPGMASDGKAVIRKRPGSKGMKRNRSALEKEELESLGLIDPDDFEERLEIDKSDVEI